MSWSIFIYFAFAASIFWIAGSALAFKSRRAAIIASAAGSVIFLAYIVGLWITLGRPPMRTMGETRLWYSFFLSVVGLILFIAYRFKWILPFTTLMAIVFICVNLLKPQIHSMNLMPALRSVWFVPHVIVYMLGYAMMAVATILAIYLWIMDGRRDVSEEAKACDVMVRIGFAFLTMGIVMGALWAKVAWGDYWAWDPKEIWAAVTWMSYLLYIHLRKHVSDRQICYALLIFSFLMLQMSWWGINLLPAAGMSVHVS